MRNILIYWRNLSKQEKQSIMQSKNIKAITFEQIKVIYNENKLTK